MPVSPSSEPPAIPTGARAAAAPGPLFAADGTAPAPVRALADAIPLILWTSDPGGRLTSINREWEAFTGQPAGEALATESHAYVHPDDLPVVAAAWRERLPGGARAGEDFDFEYRLRDRAGRYRWHLGRLVARRASDGAVIEWVGTGTDVDAQKLAERALAAANARLQAAGVELERSNQRLQDQAAELEAANDELRAAAAELEARTADAERAAADALRERDAAAAANQAKAQFLAAMSHELRTPLNAIGGYVQLLDMGLHGPVTGEQQGALGRVTRAQRHLLGLINDILNYAKLESGRVEYDVQPVDAREVVAEVTALVEPQLAARPLSMHVALPDALPPVWADREKLRQILVNLLSNALKFTEPGGRVLVDLGTRREGRAAGGAPASDATVFLRVTDTGVGVPRDKHEAIFEPFVQVRATPVRLQEGTGLGLAISRDLARGMGGDLRVRSAPGTGSTFTLTLRRAVDPDGRFTERRVAAERRVEDERRAVDDRRHDGDAHGDAHGEGAGGV